MRVFNNSSASDALANEIMYRTEEKRRSNSRLEAYGFGTESNQSLKQIIANVDKMFEKTVSFPEHKNKLQQRQFLRNFVKKPLSPTSAGIKIK